MPQNYAKTSETQKENLFFFCFVLAYSYLCINLNVETMFFEQISAEVIFFLILYGITGVVPLMAAIYLLSRRGNAFAPDVTPPVRLRRWTASFFAVTTLTHVWWLLFYIFSGDQQSLAYLVIVMLDCVSLFTTFAGTLLAMLQDRRRSVWPE